MSNLQIFAVILLVTYVQAGAISYSAGGLGLLSGGGYGLGHGIAAAPIAIAHAPVAVAHQPVVDQYVSFSIQEEIITNLEVRNYCFEISPNYFGIGFKIYPFIFQKCFFL